MQPPWSLDTLREDSEEGCQSSYEAFKPKFGMAERFHFHQQAQLPTKMVADYVAQLWLSINCDFEAHVDALLNHFIYGMFSEGMLERLLSVKELKFQDAVDTAKVWRSPTGAPSLCKGQSLFL